MNHLQIATPAPAPNGSFAAMAQLGNAYDWLPDFLEHQAPRPVRKWSGQ